ncbi:aminotransferase class III-fold pyridoxal phosphate-dependent enzyme [Leptolyngbya sp. CCNP1308]|uniref:aminotransferase class III-fold pyridoxal phosphate-dependent enzyme n=1 Tax=Leptolyngbya sp. CCNP1308 TaxID=3110255 RepID=UPI002B20B4EE|nr:aminotransferase class III-fold pyridoxal phosphate-dependent enzyme [Leptolyngbya sp. CCNP1308]MEA5451765.1 aminotransferase class III-fold pyridoxal phosphate-dependent enzyme [Leptolyngbya sp. CCNP1308]
MNPIAIVGLACRFPGANNADEFWQLLYQGREAIAPMPPDRPWLGAAGWGGFLPDIDQFDAAFFGISPREAAYLDPQQRLLLEVCWEGLEQAAIAPQSLAGSRTGVFVGISHSDYGDLIQTSPTAGLNSHSATGTALCIAANRISYSLNLKGPSIAVDTACSSSLVAVHLAGQSLTAGDCDLALAGGVNVILRPELTRVFQQAGMMAADGRCKTFDAAADGYVRSEGCGVVVLKRLADAERAGDRILAVVQGSAINQDGLSNGLTAPNGPAQQAVICQALAQAQVPAAQISYVETHGTGTPLGDPIEVNALKAVLMGGRSPQQRCALGSLKTNLGHLEAAAGIASLIKVVLALQHQHIPAHLHLHTLNPRIDLTDTPLFIPQQGCPWDLPEGVERRLAGVSAFSFGGSNAHLVVAAAPARSAPAAQPRPWHGLMLTAKSAAALAALAGRYGEFLQAQPAVNLADVCRTAHTGRSHFAYRLMAVANSPEQLRSHLTDFAQGHPNPAVITAKAPRRPPQNPAFLFTGQGAQTVGMGRQLYETQSIVRRVLDECDAALRSQLPVPLLAVMFAETDDRAHLLHQTAYTQPVLFALAYALSELWRSWGITPGIVLGHSLGEYAAACVAGCLSWQDGLRLVTVRSRLMQQQPPEGTMAAVFAAADQVQPLLEPLAKVAIAAVNGPQNTVISGATTAIEQVLQTLSNQGIRSRPLAVSHAFHSPLMEPMLAEFAAIAQTIPSQPPQVPLISNLTGQRLTTAPDADYWCQHLRQPVQFAAGLDSLARHTPNLWLEIGPQPTLLGMARRSHPEAIQPWLPSLEPGQEDGSVMLQTLGHLAVRGLPVNWAALDAGAGRPIALPTYPFQRQSYWFTSMSTASSPARSDSPAPATVAPVQADLQQLVAKLLQVSPETLDPQAPFLELGADSIVLIEAVQAIEARFGVKVTIRQFFEDLQTLEALAAYIAQHSLSENNGPAEATLVSAPQLPVSQPSSDDNDVVPSSLVKNTAAIPAVGVQPAIAPTALEQIVAQQMQLMAQQLDLLRQAQVKGPSEIPAIAPAPDPQPPVPQSPKPHAPTPQSLTEPQQRYLNAFIQRYTQRTAESKRRKQASHSYLADSRACAGFRPSIKEMLYPIVGTQAEGSRLWDVDGNEYIDLTMGFGVHLFGHRPEFIQEAIAAQLQRGIQIGPQAELAGEVAQLIHELTGMERVTFTQSGTEAVMTALRLARTATRRRLIVRFEHAYHGHFDGVLARAGGDAAVPLAPGIPPGMVEDVLVLPYGEPSALQLIQTRASELAAVLVEPVQSRRPDLQPQGFLQDLRRITEAHGVALIFDEIITGFRIHSGGAQAWFGVEADLATYGKVLGGGMPIGIVAGKAQYMDGIDGGLWHYGDDSYPSAERTFFAGTFCKPPLAMAAARAVLLHLKQQGADLQTQLNQRTEALAQRLNTFFDQAEVPIQIVQFGSLFRFAFTGNYDLLFYHLIEQGIYVWEGRNCFLSTAHTEADVEQIIQVVQNAVVQMQRGGFLPGKSLATDPMADLSLDLPLTESQQEIWLLAQLNPEASLAYTECVWLDLRGPLQFTALHQSLQQLIHRHEALRAAINDAGTGQRIVPHLNLTLPLIDLTGVEPGEQKAEVQRWLNAEQQCPFDLTQPSLLRVQVLKLAEHHHGLVLTVHHIVVDGWSIQILLEDLSGLYNAAVQRQGAMLPPAVSYQDYIQQADRGTAAAYWQQLSLPQWRLPIKAISAASPKENRPHPPSYESAHQSWQLSTERYQRFQAWSQRQGCTPFMTLLAGFCLLLHRWSQAPELMVGISVAGQGQPGRSRLVAHCVNVLPVHSQLQPAQTLSDYLHQTRHRLLECYDHADYSLSQWVRWAQGNEGRSHPHAAPPLQPIVPVLFNLDPSLPVPDLQGLTVAAMPQPPIYVRWDLSWHLSEAEGGLHLTAGYRRDCFDEAAIAAWIAEYDTLLTLMIEHSDASASVQALNQALDDALLAQSQQLQNTLTAYNRQKLEVASRRQL